MTTHYLHTLDKYFNNYKNLSFTETYILNPKISIWDIYLFLIIFIGMIILRFLVTGIRSDVIKKGSILYNRCNKSLLDKVNYKLNISKDGAEYKWKENVWFALWHSFSFLYNFILLLSMSGYFNNKNGWVKMCLKETTGKWFFLVTEDEYNENKRGWPYMYINNYVYYFYILQISFWSSCLFYLKFEKKRKDYYVFVTHHISTISLLTYSHMLNFWRVGLVILLVHDVVDILLYLSKAIVYSKSQYKFYLNISYTCFVLSYFFFRIILYSFYVVMPLSDIHEIRIYTNGFVNSHFDVPGVVIQLGCMWLLMLLHCYWFYLIIKMTHTFIKQSINKEEIVDVRSDDEDEKITTKKKETQKLKEH
ncbi:translocation associated membrane protein, putative [Hepatocystis sp. ex Piliocolobus tephrosceles]|nr:translocation associated membrane protein, putative [Hepatocystis sp. ex Piliocolobus tephrosceles]